MSGPSRAFPQPFEPYENQGRWPNAGNPAYTAGGHAPPQQMSGPGGYSSQHTAPSGPPSHPSAAPAFPSLPTGYSYPSRSVPPPPTVQGNVSMGISGYPYITQPAAYVPAPDTSYQPPHPQMTEGVQTTIGGWSDQDARDSADEDFGQDVETTSHSTHRFLPKGGPPKNPTGGIQFQSRSQAPRPDIPCCGFCRKVVRREKLETFGGFCSEDHRQQAYY